MNSLDLDRMRDFVNENIGDGSLGCDIRRDICGSASLGAGIKLTRSALKQPRCAVLSMKIVLLAAS